jgi:hypothetical protein
MFKCLNINFEICVKSLSLYTLQLAIVLFNNLLTYLEQIKHLSFKSPFFDCIFFCSEK